MEEISFCTGSKGISTFRWSIHLSSQSHLELNFYRSHNKLIINRIYNDRESPTIEMSISDFRTDESFSALPNDCKKLLTEVVILVENAGSQMPVSYSYGFAFSEKNVIEGDYLKKHFVDDVKKSNAFFNKLPDSDLLRSNMSCFESNLMQSNKRLAFVNAENEGG